MAQLLDDFRGITGELNARGVNYAVCGGWAMAIHGFLRATLDIDLLILTEDLDTVMTVARGFGYDVEGLPLNFDGGKTQIRRISRIDKESKQLITLDLLLVTESYTDALRTKRRVKWNDGEYSVVSIAGMKRMKKIAGRPKDLIDLDYLEGLDDDAED
jgi:hypothetical protein